jgi:hypothetical protein
VGKTSARNQSSLHGPAPTSPSSRGCCIAAVLGLRPPSHPGSDGTLSKTQNPRSQNLRETTFLQLLVHTLRALDQASVVLCDRGFHHTNWLRHLLELRQAFVVHLVPVILISRGSSGGRPLCHWHPAPGQAVDLGWVLRRQDRAVQVQVVGV